MADRASVITTTPLTVKMLVAGTTFPAVQISAALYEPAPGDVVTTLPLDDGHVLVLGLFS